MANKFCSVFNVVCVVNVCPRSRSKLIDSAWVVIVPGHKMHKKIIEWIYGRRSNRLRLLTKLIMVKAKSLYDESSDADEIEVC